MASICCSPPLKNPPSLEVRFFSRAGKMEYIFQGLLGLLPAGQIAADAQVFQTELSGKMRRLSGQSTMPALALLAGFMALGPGPGNRISPVMVMRSPPAMSSFFWISSMMPERVYIRVDLPALLAPNTPYDLVLAAGNADVVQRQHVLIKDHEPLGLKHS
jgi:hypothetical protein